MQPLAAYVLPIHILTLYFEIVFALDFTLNFILFSFINLVLSQSHLKDNIYFNKYTNTYKLNTYEEQLFYTFRFDDFVSGLSFSFDLDHNNTEHSIYHKENDKFHITDNNRYQNGYMIKTHRFHLYMNHKD